jgi:histidyl-tRNA synthetase
MDITIAIDKVDKIGVEGIKEELRTRGLKDNKIELLNDLIFFSGSNSNSSSKSKIEFIKKSALYGKSANLQEGVKDIEYITTQCEASGINNISIDLTIARGLNYYTGAIVEVNAKGVTMGSIGGGGRYDDLTGLFGVPNVPGVGISFGVDRIYDVMEELKLFPKEVQVGTKALFFNLGEPESQAAFTCMQELRQKNIAAELFHENSKFDKQFKYAEKKNIPYVIIIGSKELAEKTAVIKDTRTGEQQTLPIAQLSSFAFL